jgi:hypothetical protein
MEICCDSVLVELGCYGFSQTAAKRSNKWLDWNVTVQLVLAAYNE